MSTPRDPLLFALLIGINKYVNFPDLTLGAAVPDAKAVKEYLQSKRGVHPYRIRTLYDEEATRAAIITELQWLSDENNGIGRGDPIVIYYAGHGAEANAPVGWETGGQKQKIQMLCPSDFEPKSESGNQANHIYPIPDRTLGTLIERIAAAKGDNITVIFDCCHSGSLTRDPEENPEYLVRGVGKLDDVLPPTIDEAILNQPTVGQSGQGSTTPSESLSASLFSHVLLAACGARETARESRHSKRGVFTEALLKRLSDNGGNMLSYSQLIRGLPYLDSQSPQCEGQQRHRRCFDSKDPLYIIPDYSIEGKVESDPPSNPQSDLQSDLRSDTPIYQMKAGAANGITVGSEFAIYHEEQSTTEPSSAPGLAVSPAQHSSGNRLAVVTAMEVLPYYTNVKVVSGTLPDDLDGIKAKQIKAGTLPDLQLYLPTPVLESYPLKHLSDAFEKIGTEEAGNHLPIQITLVKKEDAELAIDTLGDKIIVGASDLLVTSSGPKMLLSPQQWSEEVAATFLRRAAYYCRYLHKIQGANPFPDKVSVEIYKLTKVGGIWRPTGGNLIKDWVVDLVVGKHSYGIRIINNSNVDLYPNVFCFNSLELSIEPLYECATAKEGQLDCPLPAKAKDKLPAEDSPPAKDNPPVESNLTIGFGSGGGRTVGFSLPKGQNLDVSTIKIFLSSQAVDLSYIKQQSHTKRGGGLQADELPSAWGTICITVIQRR